MSLVHASCVDIEGIGILIRGPSGSGKSDLALRLIDEGATLVADDYCTVLFENDALTVSAPDEIFGKIEVRGLGVFSLEAATKSRLGMVVDLKSKDDIDRLPEASTCYIEQMEVPVIFIDASTASAAAKVRLALRKTHQDYKETEFLNE